MPIGVYERTPKPVGERFWPKVDRRDPDDCWEWKGARNNRGYGVSYFARKNTLAHRLSYVLSNGPIEVGLKVLHRCDNPPCVNPRHLFLGTQTTNTLGCFSKEPLAYWVSEDSGEVDRS